jgi:hypothetical protein
MTLLSEILRAISSCWPDSFLQERDNVLLSLASENLLSFWCRRHETLSRGQVGHRQQELEYSSSAGSLFWTLCLSLTLSLSLRLHVRGERWSMARFAFRARDISGNVVPIANEIEWRARKERDDVGCSHRYSPKGIICRLSSVCNILQVDLFGYTYKRSSSKAGC